MPIIMVLGGCGRGVKDIGLAELESPDTATRIRAIKWAGENKDQMAVPLLVDRLQEQDPSVRFFAIQALKRITGTDNGYNYAGCSEERAQAVERWRMELERKK